MEDIFYLQLIRKNDNKEVYTCCHYMRDDHPNTYNFDKIKSVFNYYFDRVNSGIQQQLDSPKTPEDQKKNLKLLDKKDYLIRETKSMPLGCCFQPILTEWEAVKLL